MSHPVLQVIASFYGLPRPPTFEYAVNMILAKMHYHDENFEEGFENADFAKIDEAVEENIDLACLKKLIFAELTREEPMSLGKLNSRSDSIRENGNNLMKRASMSKPSTYLPILYRYELALCFAQSSECKAKSYSNISRIYQILKKPKHALKSAEFALESCQKSDKKLKDKISNRILVIKTELMSHDDADPNVRSDLAQNTLISEFIELRDDSVVAKKLLKPGDMVAVTKSFVSTSALVFQRQFCRYCGNRVSTVKIPCKSCPYATFCSDNCMNLGMNGFHGLECQYLIERNMASNDYTFHLALKFACKAIETTDGKPVTKTDSYSCFDWDDKAGSDDLSILKAIMNMKKVDMNLRQMIEVTFKLEMLFEVKYSPNQRLQRFYNFLAKFNGGSTLFKDWFLRIYPILKLYTLINDYTYTIDGFYGNLTHSCRPNLLVLRDAEHGVNKYIVLQGIKPGEKLTVALADTYAHGVPYQIRKPFLKNNFGLNCKCDACEEKLQPEVLNIVVDDFFKEIEKVKDTTDFQKIIKQFVKPDYNYYTKKTLFMHLFYISLGQMSLDRTFEYVHNTFKSIEKGLM